jgi:hypothetical protein
MKIKRGEQERKGKGECKIEKRREKKCGDKEKRGNGRETGGNKVKRKR